MSKFNGVYFVTLLLLIGLFAVEEVQSLSG